MYPPSLPLDARLARGKQYCIFSLRFYGSILDDQTTLPEPHSYDHKICHSAEDNPNFQFPPLKKVVSPPFKPLFPHKLLILIILIKILTVIQCIISRQSKQTKMKLRVKDRAKFDGSHNIQVRFMMKLSPREFQILLKWLYPAFPQTIPN